jgi:hypothetical protein
MSNQFKHSPEQARQLWIQALRSPDAKQTTGYLGRVDGSRCCLGVACDVFAKHEEGLAVTEGGRVMFYDGCQAELPRIVRDWLRLSDPAGGWNGSDLPCLAKRNDNGATFAEIAKIIEAAPEGLFVEAK